MSAETSTSIRNETDLIAAFGGSGPMSRSLGMLQSRVSNWTTVGVSPSAFEAIVEGAKRLGIAGITYDLLFDMRRRRREAMGEISRRNGMLRSA